MWKAVRHTQNRAPRQACLPDIRKSDGGYATEPRDKIEELKKVSLPAPHSADLSNILNFQYPSDLPMPCITKKELLQIGKHLQIKKAPRPDQIPNKVLKVIMPEISDYLVHIFNYSLSIGYYPLHFKKSVIVILRKPGGARNYTSSKNYRPISLLNTLRKIMEAVLATKISYMATTHYLLPKTHFGGQRGSCVETAIHHLLEKIYAAWNKDKIASLLMMDVSAAYPNISHQRLLHNLRKRKIDRKVVNWVALFLTNRQTIVKTNKQYAKAIHGSWSSPGLATILHPLFLLQCRFTGQLR